MPSKAKSLKKMRKSSKCTQGKHRNRATKKCRCTKVCRKVGGKSRKN